MKSYYKFILLILLSIITNGCVEDKDEPNNDVEYYVKYEADVRNSYAGSGNDIKYTVNTDNGSKTFANGSSYSQVFGPVKKGFNAYITVDARRWSNARCNVKISVCRGNEPFALKASNSGGQTASTSYTIDY